MTHFINMRASCLSLLFGAAALAGAVAAAESDFDSAIDRLTRLSYQTSTTEMARQVAPLMDRLDEASPSQRARILYLQARLLGLQGQYQQSLELTDQALAEAIPNDRALPLTRLAANIAVNAGRPEMAFEYLRRALSLLETVEEPFEHASVLGLSSQLQIEAGNSDWAVVHAQAGLAQAKRTDDPRSHCAAAIRAAAALIANRTADQALAIAMPAMPGCRQTGDAVLIGSILNEVANAYLELGETLPVGPLLDEAEALLTGYYHQGALFSRVLALRWLLAEDRPATALESSEPLIAELERLALWRRLDDALEIKARAHLALSDAQASYDARRRQLIARQSYIGRESLLKLAHAEIDFEATRGQQQLTFLQEQARVNALQDQARQSQLRLRLFYTGLAVTVLVLLGLLLFHAITERRHFRRLARHDGLTGLPNHGSFFSHLNAEVQRADHGDRNLSLVLADIDHFKSINDHCGHQLGDAVLRQTARTMQSAFDGQGVTGRIGGEEFAVCLPGVNAAKARAMTEVMRVSLAQVSSADWVKPVTLSFGIAEHRPGETGEQLRSRADNALYAAKQRGRNQVMLA